MKAKFELGQIVATKRVLKKYPHEKISRLITRHVTGDWGDLGDEDKKLNEEALISQDRIFSAYELGKGKVYVITEWDRSATTVLLPDEY